MLKCIFVVKLITHFIFTVKVFEVVIAHFIIEELSVECVEWLRLELAGDCCSVKKMYVSVNIIKNEIL